MIALSPSPRLPVSPSPRLPVSPSPKRTRPLDIAPSLRWLLAAACVSYVALMYVLGWLAQRRVSTVEDFLVAGRRLPFSLAWMTLLATWFGAGTMLAASDEVRASGLQAAALDPWGAGCCLLLAGLLVAGPMWRMKLMTVPDFFREKFGASAELLSSLILVPSYFGWVAAQLVALSQMLELFFDIPVAGGLLLAAVVATGYTVLGGMWSVTWTDAVQVVLLLLGLVILTVATLSHLGGGFWLSGVERLRVETPAEQWSWAPTESAVALWGWLGIFATGALGNLPGQDLMQRIFAARSASVAKWSCVLAGILYLAFGALPLALALSANLLLPDSLETAILPALAQSLLSPFLAVVFVVALLSAIMSTVDSAVLAPASVLAHNVLPRIRRGAADPLRSSRWCVLFVAASSTALAYGGESAYSLLESSYALTLVGLFVPLMGGLFCRRCRNGAPAIASMLVGSGLWAAHLGLGWEQFLGNDTILSWAPASLGATGAAAAAYLIVDRSCGPAAAPANSGQTN